MNRLKERVWELLEVTFDPDDHAPAFDWVDASLAVLIVLSVLAVMLQTVDTLPQQFRGYLDAFEAFSIAVFTIEYVLRLWSCTVDPRYTGPIRGRMAYAATPMALIDVVSFAPYYFNPSSNLLLLRVFRLVRLLRVLKLGRYSRSLTLVADVLKRKRSDLVAASIVLVIALVLASTVMYHIEHDAQPQAFSSIPDSMWWVLSTFTPVSSGDVVPATPQGKLAGAIVAILGVAIFALPAGILADGFSEERKKREAGVGTADETGPKPQSPA